MLTKLIYGTLIAFFLFLQSCGVLIFNEDKMAMKKYRIHQELYQPYKLQNTIEGYREFIAKYPKNIFVTDAKLQIENLEFTPYEREDSIEGYMEFKTRFPRNRYVFNASVKIEQVELKRYEAMDTIAGYEEFLSKYPESTFAVLAKERLQELEFRALDGTLQKEYGFDLLGYRLHLKRLKKELTPSGGVTLGEFICFASLPSHQEKNYFHTYLIYPSSLSHLDATSPATVKLFFDFIISKALIYLDTHFTGKGKIDGFSFEVSSSTHSFYRDRITLLEYYLPMEQTTLFAAQKITTDDLLASSTTVIPPKEDIAALKQPRQPTGQLLLSETATVPSPLDGESIMTMVSGQSREKDHIISRYWETGKHTMKNIEKRINLGGKEGFIDKSVIRYIEPTDRYGTSLLIWNYQDREKALWCQSPRTEATRVTNTERVRPPAEFDFCLNDYIDIKLKDERHQLLRNEEYQGKACYLIESIPIKNDLSYGKRVSWIDQRGWLPLKIEYFDKKGELWKVLTIEWHYKFGSWFWKQAVVDNIHTKQKTVITTEDVRVNVGLDERDFSISSLEQKQRSH